MGRHQSSGPPDRPRCVGGLDHEAADQVDVGLSIDHMPWASSSIDLGPFRRDPNGTDRGLPAEPARLVSVLVAPPGWGEILPSARAPSLSRQAVR